MAFVQKTAVGLAVTHRAGNGVGKGNIHGYFAQSPRSLFQQADGRRGLGCLFRLRCRFWLRFGNRRAREPQISVILRAMESRVREEILGAAVQVCCWDIQLCGRRVLLQRQRQLSTQTPSQGDLHPSCGGDTASVELELLCFAFSRQTAHPQLAGSGLHLQLSLSNQTF